MPDQWSQTNLEGRQIEEFLQAIAKALTRDVYGPLDRILIPTKRKWTKNSNVQYVEPEIRKAKLEVPEKTIPKAIKSTLGPNIEILPVPNKRQKSQIRPAPTSLMTAVDSKVVEVTSDSSRYQLKPKIKEVNRQSAAQSSYMQIPLSSGIKARYNEQDFESTTIF